MKTRKNIAAMVSLSTIISSIFFSSIDGGFIKRRVHVRPVVIQDNKNKENDTLKKSAIRLIKRRAGRRAFLRR